MAQGIVEGHIADFVSHAGGGFAIRKLSEIDREVMARFNIELYKDEFNAARYRDVKEILRFWEWKYAANPAAVKGSNYGWVALYKDEPVGQFHIMPVDIKAGDGYFKGAWGSDLAILKKYRSLGVSAFLIQKAREDAARDYSFFLLGGMNLNSYTVFKNSGFIDLGKVPRYVRMLDVRAVSSRCGMSFWLSAPAIKAAEFVSRLTGSGAGSSGGTLRISTVDRFDGRFDAFWGSTSRHYNCIAKRDAAFLNWRYIDQPLWKYTVLSAVRRGELCGFLVLREGGIKNGPAEGLKTGVISDMLVDPSDPSAGSALLERSIGIFKASGAALVRCDLLDRRLERILRSNGFIGIPPANEFMLNVHGEKMPARSAEAASARGGWTITLGDSDLDFD